MSCPSSDDWPYSFFNHQLSSSSPQQSYSTTPYNANYQDSTTMVTTVTDSIITTSSYGTDMAPSQLSCSALISSNSPSSSASSKQVKKRSRASKKTPTMLVNADTSNFRSLVQQFTGCPNTPSSLMTTGPYKGPLNINFAQGDEDDVGVEEYSLNSSKNSLPFDLTSGDGYGYASNIRQQQLGFSHQNRASGDHPAGSYVNRSSSGNIADCAGGSLSVEDYFDWGTTGSSTTFGHDFK